MTTPIEPRRSFAIISHPDAGKTTLTEKLLLFGGAINLAGSIKSKKASCHATSDWMKIEQERGISVSSSVMQFAYKDHLINLLDTPGHADFTEDTYRTLTAVDSAMMVIDAAKGVEARTIKLMDVCRMRKTPILTFINKMDRETREPIELLDEIESVLSMECAPITWPIGMGSAFKGIYHLLEDRVYLYQANNNATINLIETIDGIDNPLLDSALGDDATSLRETIALVRGASYPHDTQAYLSGQRTPVFFGSAINNFGIRELLDTFVQQSPPPLPRACAQRLVKPDEAAFSGFVFKIQANMDPHHRDRIAFLRIVSGRYHKGIRVYQPRIKKTIHINQALTFLAGKREHTQEAFPGDIIGLHNHGTIQIGDTFTSGEELKFTGIPNFAPEQFRSVRLQDPLKQKTLQKGLKQLSEEGATQLFIPLFGNRLILGAIGSLQFDVVAYRLQHEYHCACIYEPVSIASARWVQSSDKEKLERFKIQFNRYLANDGAGHLTYLAPSPVNLELTQEQWPEIQFLNAREH